MSDDDRMDRAERIRKMREGNRTETDAESTEATSADDAAARADEAAAANEESTTTTDDDADAEMAMAAAQRAAQTAAAVTGGADEADEATAQANEELQAATGATTTAKGPTGVELPDEQVVEAAMAESEAEETTGAAGAATMDEGSTQSEELVRVLEFSLGEEYYCLDIEYVEEIVKREDVTRVPNTEAYVEGVVDLRGQITTILDPKAMMDIDDDGDQNLIVVFDPEVFEEQGAVGWIVDEVRQVSPVAEEEVNSPPVDADYINGVVDRAEREQFVIWVEPDDALESATAADD